VLGADPLELIAADRGIAPKLAALVRILSH